LIINRFRERRKKKKIGGRKGRGPGSASWAHDWDRGKSPGRRPTAPGPSRGKKKKKELAKGERRL